MEDSHPDPGLPLPPLGGLLLRPGAAADVIVGNTTEVGAFYGRYWPLWASTADRRDARRLHRRYCDALARVREPAGISIIEYVGPCDDAPNALAHPDFGHDVWDRWQPAATDNRHFDIDPLSSPALARDRATGKGRFAVFYDPPWTIPFLRRNEVAVPVSGG